MIGLYAGVCILDNPYHIDGVYDYLIPPEMGETVTAGRFVTVPFGIRNRVCLGLIVEIRRHSDYKDVKYIKTVCPETVALDGEMQGLCSFMKSRTLCSTGDAVRAMVPASAISRLEELYSCCPTYKGNSDEIRSSDLFVYEYLKENGETCFAKLRERFDIRVEGSFRRLLALGAIQKRVVFREPTEGKAVRFWSLAVPGEVAERLAAGEKAGTLHLTSMAHKSILSVLLEKNGEAMCTEDLAAEASATSAQIRALLKKGLLSVEERRIDRNPYTEFEFLGRTPQTLNPQQDQALKTLWELCESGEPKAALLHGVTGSGKTRVMTALIDRLLDAGRGVIVLLPEIALTPQSVSVFCSRYGDRVAVIHSALSNRERYDSYCRIRRGEADVVIGTRSAVFSPVKNLGAIIIDEEQEHTYKSDQSPRYHTKDIARYRCNHHKALMLLASATPSLESYKKAKEGIYTLVTLTERCGTAKLPTVTVADMREEARQGNSSELSLAMVNAIRETLDRKEQIILFLNRRGYNRSVTCRSCGAPIVCPNCSVAMTYHTRRGSYSEGEMVCHWCGTRLPVPRACPACGSEHLGFMGYGTQRMEETVAKLFPDAKILRMDADTTVSKHSYTEMLGAFRRHEADILLGTQMVTKGHDFPDVTLVGVLMADTSLYLDDYRASERTFAMLTQVIGRAGRGRLPGRAIIQTANPDSEIIQLACRQDYPTFFERELRLRRLLCFPPACDIALLTVSGRLEPEVMLACKRLTEELEIARKSEKFSSVELIPFGPFEAPVYRVDNKYRMRMVIKCRLTKDTLTMFHVILCAFSAGCGHHAYLSIDFNPSSL